MFTWDLPISLIHDFPLFWGLKYGTKESDSEVYSKLRSIWMGVHLSLIVLACIWSLILSLVSDCLTKKSFRGQNRVDVVAREALFIEQIIKEFFKTNSSFDAPGSDIRLNLQTYNVILS